MLVIYYLSSLFRYRTVSYVIQKLCNVNEMKWKCSDFKCIRKPTKSRLSLTHHANKSSRWAEQIRGISPVGKAKVYGEKDVLKSQVLSSEWNTKRVREDASLDSKDGEHDELPCVIGESAGDCVW